MSDDLFGVTPKQYAPVQTGKRRDPVPKGYAGIPGTGPEGKCCKHCARLKQGRTEK